MEKTKEENYVYILRCGDNTLYTGWTNDLEKRLKAHSQGKGAKYTKGRGPLSLVYYECFASREEAMRREYAIKQMSRDEKMKLIEIGTKKEFPACESVLPWIPDRTGLTMEKQEKDPDE